jgi:hypothetical protein
MEKWLELLLTVLAGFFPNASLPLRWPQLDVFWVA